MQKVEPAGATLDPAWTAMISGGAGAVAALAAVLGAPPSLLLGLGAVAAGAGAWTVAGLRAERRRRMMSESILQAGTRTAEDIIAAIPSGLVGLDETGSVCRWNEVATRILGMGRGGMIGQHVDRWPIAGQRGLAALLRDALEGKTVNRGSLDVTRTDGKIIPLGISTSRLGGGSGAVAVFQDLTEARKLRARMQQQERLAAVGALAASIAHEIRNPLASIAGSVELLAGELELSGEHRVLLDLIIKESDRLNALIGEFLDFTRERQPSPEVLDPSVLLREVLRLLRQRSEAGEQLRLTLGAEDAPAQVEADPGMLKQVLLNLLLNAAQAVNWRGALKVTLAQAPASDCEKGATGHCLTIDVADDGPGIAAADKEHVFEPFFTTKPGGTGLGLAIAHRLVRLHGGQLELVESEGPGAVFRVRLPLLWRGAGDATGAHAPETTETAVQQS